MKVVTVVWKTCPVCDAQRMRPLPDGWSYTVKATKYGVSHVTPHLGSCPAGFQAVELPDDE
jgi:hypothetical protein